MKNNDHHVIGETSTRIIYPQIFSNGIQKLNTNKYNYLFGLSCISCDCEDCDGFEFKVSFA